MSGVRDLLLLFTPSLNLFYKSAALGLDGLSTTDKGKLRRSGDRVALWYMTPPTQVQLMLKDMRNLQVLHHCHCLNRRHVYAAISLDQSRL